jgi:hypothetical protein
MQYNTREQGHLHIYLAKQEMENEAIKHCLIRFYHICPPSVVNYSTQTKKVTEAIINFMKQAIYVSRGDHNDTV